MKKAFDLDFVHLLIAVKIQETIHVTKAIQFNMTCYSGNISALRTCFIHLNLRRVLSQLPSLRDERQTRICRIPPGNTCSIQLNISFIRAPPTRTAFMHVQLEHTSAKNSLTAQLRAIVCNFSRRFISNPMAQCKDELTTFYIKELLFLAYYIETAFGPSISLCR